ncbi:sdpI/YhfL family protein [Burkholderia pseudomallei]|nr:sdpI/YhfL family protein [Burkholderia pseudomallei]KGX25867.1 sdpI/YhfL family protein [Burkholderia pseudomallei]
MLDRPETVSYLLASALFFALAVPLAAQRIAPNRFYGVRTRATLRNPALWYRRNRVFGVALMITSATFIVVAEYCRLRGVRLPDAALLAAFVAEIAVPIAVCFAAGVRPKRPKRRAAARATAAGASRSRAIEPAPRLPARATARRPSGGSGLGDA